MNSNISDHLEPEFQRKIIDILKNHQTLFRRRLERFNDDITMSISFKNEKNINDLKQSSFFMSVKNKKAMNDILDFLIKDGRVQKIFLKMISSAVFSAFVIWKNDKSRIMMNLKKINTKLYSDVYSLSKQNIILSFLSESKIFSFIDFTKRFFQQNINFKNYWKTIFVTFHKKLKWLTIFSMNFENTSDFFQNRMKKIFETYLWKFVLMYMNDIIIYSKNSIDHLTHLDEILDLLKNFDVTLFLAKCHFAYSSIKAFEHHVSRLDLSILKKKTEIIRKLKFFEILKKLKIDLNFFDYNKKFVKWYVDIKKSLQILKTLEFKNNFVKNKIRLKWANRTKFVRVDELEKKQIKKNKTAKSIEFNRVLKFIAKNVTTWKTLKKTLIEIFTLTFSDFFLFFIVYVDESKEKNYEIAFH